MTFLVQNWFKIGLLAILTSFSVAYFVSNKPNDQTANILQIAESNSPIPSESVIMTPTFSPTPITQKAVVKPSSKSTQTPVVTSRAQAPAIQTRAPTPIIPREHLSLLP